MIDITIKNADKTEMRQFDHLCPDYVQGAIVHFAGGNLYVLIGDWEQKTPDRWSIEVIGLHHGHTNTFFEEPGRDPDDYRLVTSMEVTLAP